MSRWYDSIAQQWVDTDFEFGKRKREPEVTLIGWDPGSEPASSILLHWAKDGTAGPFIFDLNLVGDGVTDNAPKLQRLLGHIDLSSDDTVYFGHYIKHEAHITPLTWSSDEMWLPWDGKGRPPLMLGDRVQVMERDGEIDEGRADDFDWEWEDEPYEGDITAYRKLPETA